MRNCNPVLKSPTIPARFEPQSYLEIIHQSFNFLILLKNCLTEVSVKFPSVQIQIHRFHLKNPKNAGVSTTVVKRRRHRDVKNKEK